MIARPAEDDEEDMDPEEAKRIVGEVLGFDPDSVDKETLEKEMGRILDDLRRRLEELG